MSFRWARFYAFVFYLVRHDHISSATEVLVYFPKLALCWIFVMQGVPPQLVRLGWLLCPFVVIRLRHPGPVRLLCILASFWTQCMLLLSWTCHWPHRKTIPASPWISHLLFFHRSRVCLYIPWDQSRVFIVFIPMNMSLYISGSLRHRCRVSVIR